MTMLPWVKLPTAWIQEKRLNELRWSQGHGSNNVAALTTLIVLAHHADQTTGEVQLTYDALQKATELSRPKISDGLTTLLNLGVLQRHPTRRSWFQLVDFDPTRDWGKLPAKVLYASGRVPFVCDMKLRSRAELDALKMLLLIVTRRDNSTNEANMTYEKIEDYTGIDRNRIRRAVSLLAISGIIHVNASPSSSSIYGISSGYRLAHIDPRRHAGTIGRGNLAAARPG